MSADLKPIPALSLIDRKPIQRPYYDHTNYDVYEQWVADNKDKLREWYVVTNKWLDADDEPECFETFCKCQHTFTEHQAAWDRIEDRRYAKAAVWSEEL